jgi:hypothetical protein
VVCLVCLQSDIVVLANWAVDGKSSTKRWSFPTKKNRGMQFRLTGSLETKKTKLYGTTMTNYDEIFEHVTLPIYRGCLEMKILDQTI